MTIGKQIAVGFIFVIVVLSILSWVSYSGVSSVSKRAEASIAGNRISGDLIQKELNHHRWMSALGAAITQINKGERFDQILSDGQKAWRISEEEKRYIEKIVPDAALLLLALRHDADMIADAVVRMQDVYQVPHPELVMKLEKIKYEHDRYLNNAARAIEEGSRLENAQQLLKNLVKQAISILKACVRDPSLGDDETRLAVAKTLIKHLRFGEKEKDYCFIIDDKPQMVMHPYHPELYDEDLSIVEDSKGRRMFARMVEIAKEKGKGFLNRSYCHIRQRDETNNRRCGNHFVVIGNGRCDLCDMDEQISIRQSAEVSRRNECRARKRVGGAIRWKQRNSRRSIGTGRRYRRVIVVA